MTMAAKTGQSAEKQARELLEDKGWAILETNYHSRFGEIDLIARDEDTLVFVEIKNYKKSSLLGLYQSISKSKQKKIIQTARMYIMQKNIIDTPMRFDVMLYEEGSLKEHLKGAFFI
jgi:putative endonuclease